jgi:Cephalosporin hydroxylase
MSNNAKEHESRNVGLSLNNVRYARPSLTQAVRMRNLIKKLLTRKQQQEVKNLLSRFYSNDLNKLATLHETDKWNKHWYTQHYQRHFHHLRQKRLNLLEIGVGGYENPHKGGNSLRMWKHYFPHANIYAIDIHDKHLLEQKRIKIFQGSQVDEQFLKDVYKQTGSSLDIIIDDGSHINDHVIRTFKILFPLLQNGGIYAVEDTQTSYWPKYGGDSENLNNRNTMMNFFKGLTDCLNHAELNSHEPTYFDTHIVEMHFYHNLVFVHKGLNDEGSSRPRRTCVQ